MFQGDMEETVASPPSCLWAILTRGSRNTPWPQHKPTANPTKPQMPLNNQQNVSRVHLFQGQRQNASSLHSFLSESSPWLPMERKAPLRA